MDVRDASRILFGLSVYFISSAVKGRLQAWQQKKLNKIHEKEVRPARTIRRDDDGPRTRKSEGHAIPGPLRTRAGRAPGAPPSRTD